MAGLSYRESLMLPRLVLEFCLDHSLGQAPSHIPGRQLNVALVRQLAAMWSLVPHAQLPTT